MNFKNSLCIFLKYIKQIWPFNKLKSITEVNMSADKLTKTLDAINDLTGGKKLHGGKPEPVKKLMSHLNDLIEIQNNDEISAAQSEKISELMSGLESEIPKKIKNANVNEPVINLINQIKTKNKLVCTENNLKHEEIKASSCADDDVITEPVKDVKNESLRLSLVNEAYESLSKEVKTVSSNIRKISLNTTDLSDQTKGMSKAFKDILTIVGKKVSDIDSSLKGSINNGLKILSEKSDSILKASDNNKLRLEKIESIVSDIPKDTLKSDDFTFELNNKFKEFDSLKEVAEELESLPANTKFIKSALSNIGEKLDNISVPSSANKSSAVVPQEEQAVTDLAQYMRDGVEQFENMSRLYVSKISDLQKMEQLKEKHKTEIKDAEESGVKRGRLAEKVSLARALADKYPSEFNEIQSIFEDVISHKYAAGEKITITNDNKNETMPYISEELELAEYEVIKPVLLINGDIAFKADVKKIDEAVVEPLNSEPSPDEIVDPIAKDG